MIINFKFKWSKSPWLTLRTRNFKCRRVNARQRPGGVAWDAVPLTVRGLNKAAGNPPFSRAAAAARDFNIVRATARATNKQKL